MESSAVPHSHSVVAVDGRSLYCLRFPDVLSITQASIECDTEIHWMLADTLDVGRYIGCWQIHWMLADTLDVGRYTGCWQIH